MALFVAGLNPHRPLFPLIVQQLADPSEYGRLAKAAATHRSLSEALVVSDGARVELYAVAEKGVDAYDIAADLLGADANATEVASSLYFAEGIDAVSHLLAAVSGLDEFAETDTAEAGEELARAFGAALADARANGSAGPALASLATAATALAASLSAAQTGASADALAETTVELSRRVFGHVERRGVIVVGDGPLTAPLCQGLFAAGVDDFTFLGPDDAAELARARGARAITPEALSVAIANADIVIAGAAVEGVVLDRRLMRGAVRARRGRPSLLVDGSRDGSLVEAKVSSFDSVFLYTADDLAAITRDAPWAGRGATASREQLLADAIRSLELKLAE